MKENKAISDQLSACSFGSTVMDRIRRELKAESCSRCLFSGLPLSPLSAFFGEIRCVPG